MELDRMDVFSQESKTKLYPDFKIRERRYKKIKDKITGQYP